jgi:hypothetical protein
MVTSYHRRIIVGVLVAKCDADEKRHNFGTIVWFSRVVHLFFDNTTKKMLYLLQNGFVDDMLQFLKRNDDTLLLFLVLHHLYIIFQLKFNSYANVSCFFCNFRLQSDDIFVIDHLHGYLDL